MEKQMSLAKELHSILNDLGYDRCGGHSYKKELGGITLYIDNPFSGWDNEDDQESFVLDFHSFVTMSKELNFGSTGKITVELSTIFKAGDSFEDVESAEDDLIVAVSRILQK